MSQIFRVLRKVSKNQTNVRTNQATNEENTAKTADTTSLDISRDLGVVDSVDCKLNEQEVAREAEEDANIEKSIEDLRNFSEQMDEFVETAKAILNRAYISDAEKILQRRLKNSAAELMSIQNEMKTIMDNITTLKMQIAAVRDNIEDHKNKFNSVKTEERRTRFFLSHENNKRDKNARNLERNVHKDHESRAPKFLITPATGELPRPAAGGTPQTTFLSIGPTQDSHNNRSNSSSPETQTNRSVRPFNNRPLVGAVKRVKALRVKRQAPPLPAPQNDPPGVTVVLQPITEPAKPENFTVRQSHLSTPSESLANFPWLNNNQPEQTLSDSRSNSVTSASNSLFVFTSSGRFDDLD